MAPLLQIIKSACFLGGITNTENKAPTWPGKSQNNFENNFGLKDPVLAPTINTIPNNGNNNGIVSILPAPPQVISKYNVEHHAHQEQQHTPAKNTNSARLPRNYFSPSVPDISTKYVPKLLQQNRHHFTNNKIVPAALINSVATSNQHHSISSSNNNNNKIVPAALINSVSTSNQHHSIITSNNNSNNKIVPAVLNNSVQQATNNAQQPFVPVSAPNWLKQPRRNTASLNSFPYPVLNKNNNQNFVKPATTSHKFWEQIPAARPVLSHIQKPLSRRRPKNIVVKHGIYPLLKSRRRYPTRFFQ